MQGVQGLQGHQIIQVVVVVAQALLDKMLSQVMVALVELVQHHL
jgi:hypothetical protein